MKKNSFIGKIIRLIEWCVFVFFPIDKKKVVVSNYVGCGYGDNPKYIVEKLLRMNAGITIIWLVRDNKEYQTLPDGVNACFCRTWREVYHLSTARVWIDNCRKGRVFKKKGQYYLQTWHGFAMKRIEKDAEGTLGKRYTAMAKRDSKHTDLMISDSRFMTDIYRRSFWYNGPIQEWGAPRNDIFSSDISDMAEKVKAYYNLHSGKKIILYAPTFRADHSIEAYALDFKRLVVVCQEKFGGDFVVLVRLHPNIVDKCSMIHFDGQTTVNATRYPDIQELLSAAHIVISDYSSLMFDYAITKRPCFIFATDIDAYKKDRNFYFDITSTPFSISVNNDELEENIKHFSGTDYVQKVENFLEHFGIIADGSAGEKCAEWVLSKLEKERSE